MNPASVPALLGRDVLRSSLTLLAPGAILLAPYTQQLLVSNAQVGILASREVGAAIVLFAIAAIGVGLLLENLGALIESELWDRILKRRDAAFDETWRAYWVLAFQATEEPVGQHYVRTMVLQMKAELACSLAVLGALPGAAVIAADASWSIRSLVLGIVLGSLLFIYLLWESFSSARVLAEVRRELVAAFRESRPTSPGNNHST